MPHDPYKKLYEDLKAKHDKLEAEQKRSDDFVKWVVIGIGVIILLSQAWNYRGM